MANNIIFKSIVSGSTANITVDKDVPITGEMLHELVAQREGIPSHLIAVTNGTKRIQSTSQLLNFDGPDIVLQVFIPCPGGKGGFGSMLRAIGAQIEKTTNKDACRDLSGRRLRDVNAEKKIKDFIAKSAKRREQENKKRKEKLARLRRDPKIEFKDSDYFKLRSEIPEVVDDAVKQGLKKVLGLNQKTTASATVTSCATAASASQAQSEPLAGPSWRQDPLPSSNSSSTNEASKLKAQVPPAAPLPTRKKKTNCLWLGVDEEDVSSSDED